MIKILEEIDLKNYILILPSVAVGNVGQLSIDLLISSLNLHKIGSIWNSAFLPIAGLDPYNKDSNSLCAMADFYLGTAAKVICLQLRSPCIGRSKEFFDELVKFIQDKKIEKTVILTSSYDYERCDRSSSSLQFLALDKLATSLLENTHFTRHEKKNALTATEKSRIAGGGFANALYDRLLAEEIPCVVLYRYCSEGDNVSDALELTNGLNQWLNLLPSNVSGTLAIKFPPSWDYLFGNPPPSDMY